jgi:acyl carrier protein
MITREHARERLESYLRQQVAERDQLVDLTPGLDLIDNRVIDSLGFMGLLMVIEELAEQPVDVQQLSADDFRTLDRIGARFLAHLPSAEVARV